MTFRRDEQGAIVVLVGLLMSALLLLAGLAVDGGMLFAQRRAQQEAADAAAFGGAVVLYNGGTATQAIAAAQADAQLNGYVTDLPRTVVTITSPPTSGPHALNPVYVFVQISRQLDTFLIGRGQTWTVYATAEGGAQQRPIQFGFLVLNPTAIDSFLLSNSGSVTVNGGDLLVDSNAASYAAQRTGSGVLTMQSGYTAKSVGGQSGFTGWTTGAPALADPLAGRVRPSTAGMTTYNNTSIGGTATLGPGIYNNGISITGSGTVTFDPGIYILKGGGISVGGTASVVGSGVMIFNTLSDYPTLTGTCGSVALSGGGTLSLTAASTGYYQGLLVWQDTLCTQTMTITGNGAITTPSGTVYIPKALVNVAGTGGMTLTQLIADRINVQSQGSITVNYSQAAGAQPLLPALVE